MKTPSPPGDLSMNKLMSIMRYFPPAKCVFSRLSHSTRIRNTQNEALKAVRVVSVEFVFVV